MIYGYGHRQTKRLLKISRNIVKKYWEGTTTPCKRTQGIKSKNDVLIDEYLKFIDEYLEVDKLESKKQLHTAHRIFTRLCEGKGCWGRESAVEERKKRITTRFMPLTRFESLDELNKYLCEKCLGYQKNQIHSSGKTHLAIALGINSCCAGLKVRFCTTVALANELSEALQEGRMSKLERSLIKFDFLIIN